MNKIDNYNQFDKYYNRDIYKVLQCTEEGTVKSALGN